MYSYIGRFVSKIHKFVYFDLCILGMNQQRTVEHDRPQQTNRLAFNLLKEVQSSEPLLQHDISQ